METAFFIKQGRPFYFSVPRFQFETEHRLSVLAHSLPDQGLSTVVHVTRDLKVTQEIIDLHITKYEERPIQIHNSEEMFCLCEALPNLYRKREVLEALLQWL